MGTGRKRRTKRQGRPGRGKRRDAPSPAGEAAAAAGAPPAGLDEARPYAGRRYILGALHPDTSEMRELAATLGLVRLAEVVQPRARPNRSLFFGSGKVDDLAVWIKSLRVGDVPDDWVPGDAAWEPLPESVRQALHDLPAAEGHPNAPGEEDGHEDLDEDDDRDDRWRDDPVASVSVRGQPVHSGTFGRGPSRSQEGKAGGRQDLQTSRMPSYVPSRDPPLLLVLDGDVRPSVLFNLEEHLGIEVWDRTRLILEIFSSHAHVKEARLQVELAKLQYEVPLVREAIHRKRGGERPGFMGGGEYGVADYQDFIKRRMRTVKDELTKIRSEREVRRRVRKKGFYLASLAGYTNAGKSTLLNALTGADVVSQDVLFATLGTTTRRLSGRIQGGDRGMDDLEEDEEDGFDARDQAEETTPGGENDGAAERDDPAAGAPPHARAPGSQADTGPERLGDPVDGARSTGEGRAADAGNGRTATHTVTRFDRHRHEPGEPPRGTPEADPGKGDPFGADGTAGKDRSADPPRGRGRKTGVLGDPLVAHGGEKTNRSGPEDDGSETDRHSESDVDTEVHPSSHDDPINRYERPLLLTDTVGFIQSLPGWLLDAFHSTLEEIALSDVVLLTVDVSDDLGTMLEKIRVCKEELAFLDVQCPILLVLNKADLLPDAIVDQRIRHLLHSGDVAQNEVVAVSARSGTGLEELRERIEDVLPPLRPYETQMMVNEGGAGDSAHKRSRRLLDTCFDSGEVLDYAYATPDTQETWLRVRGRCDPIHRRRLLRTVQELDTEFRWLARR